jgi:uncharacterized membrane protein HdeD (DUF308 family)
LLLAEGVLGVLAGLVVFFWPGMTALVLLFLISAWAILTGLLKVFTVYNRHLDGSGLT